MVELHIDDIKDELLTLIYHECPFGGKLSIRMQPEERPLLSFGHDECIFHQFIFTGHSWRGKNGEQPIIPKDEGYGLMVSTFQSRELEFGYKLTSEQLATVNYFWQSTRPHYLETESALKVNDKTEESDLIQSPFIKYFEYGYMEGKEGY
jgi:hypothetical protein